MKLRMKGAVVLCAVLLLVVVVGTEAKAVSYRQGRNNKFYLDLVPVASTVFPLEDLPEYKVGIGFHLQNIETNLTKPEGPIKLITAKKTKKPSLAKVKQVSKKEFEKTG